MDTKARRATLIVIYPAWRLTLSNPSSMPSFASFGYVSRESKALGLFIPRTRATAHWHEMTAPISTVCRREAPFPVSCDPLDLAIPETPY